MVLERPHQHPVAGGEIAKLALKKIAPLVAVKEIVPVAIDDDENDGDTVDSIVVSALEHGCHQRGLIVVAQVQVLVMGGEGTVSDISVAEIGQRLRIGIRMQHAVGVPGPDGLTDRMGVAMSIKNACFKEAPEQSETDNGGLLLG